MSHMGCKLFIANGCYIVLGNPNVIHTVGFLNEDLHVTNTSKLLENKQHGLQNCHHQYTKFIRTYKAHLSPSDTQTMNEHQHE